MVPKVFLDTNIVIDHLTDRQSFANDSSMLFELHELGKIKIYISALSVNTVYYVSRKLIGDKPTLALIEKLIDDLEIFGTTKKEIRKAFETGFKDFEDSIQYATALASSEIEAIITRDTKDFRKSIIAVYTPKIYLRQL